MTDETVQQRVIDELLLHFKNMQIGLPASDPYTVEFEDVFEHAIEEADTRKRAVLSILWLDEVAERDLHCYRKTMRIALEFRHWNPPGQSTERTMQLVIGAIQRRALELGPGGSARGDGTMILDVLDLGAEPGLDDLQDAQANGTVYIQVLYKHSVTDPRTPHA